MRGLSRAHFTTDVIRSVQIAREGFAEKKALNSSKGTTMNNDYFHFQPTKHPQHPAAI
jgi:hypothetical protein